MSLPEFLVKCRNVKVVLCNIICDNVTVLADYVVKTKSSLSVIVNDFQNCRGKAENFRVFLDEEFEKRPLCEIRMPVPCVIAIVRRGSRVIIPKGSTVIEPNDKLLVFTKSKDVVAVKEYFN